MAFLIGLIGQNVQLWWFQLDFAAPNMQPWIWKPPKSENTGKNGFGMTVTERDWAWRKLKTILKNSTYRKISVTERDGGSQWKFRWFQAVPEIFNSSLSTYPQKMDWLYVSPFVFPHFVWDVSHILVQLLVLLPGYSGAIGPKISLVDVSHRGRDAQGTPCGNGTMFFCLGLSSVQVQRYGSKH